MKLFFFILFFVLLSFSGCLRQVEVNEVKEITSFEECIKAGNPVMESYPRQCIAGGKTFVEVIEKEIFFCSPEQRNAEACIALYNPVCAKVNVQCIRAPCPPINETFSNSCHACANPLVESYVLGECE